MNESNLNDQSTYNRMSLAVGNAKNTGNIAKSYLEGNAMSRL